MSGKDLSNEDIAQYLERIAELLEAQGANPHRVRAYRNGANTIRSTGESVVNMVRSNDRKTLENMQGIGKGLAGTITELVRNGRSNLLDRLEGEVTPEILFDSIPGLGKELAHRIHEELGIETLEELEMTAHDGRLEEISGFGSKRIQALQDILAGILSRSGKRRSWRSGQGASSEGTREQPAVALLLEVDSEYRRKAEQGKLKKIAPRRFNPEGRAWLPILHTEHGKWSFTALYSNTARAHELDKIHDWVVIYYERDGEEQQCTVVTEEKGPLRNMRVVRGREMGCRNYYKSNR
ncbi:MAG: helix-hairpin-helix domain-containing protein [Calditrichia bacterium]